jgi:uncharacterized protein (UPF0333 family)
VRGVSETNGKISKAGAAVVLGIVVTVAGGMFVGFQEVASLIRDVEASHKAVILTTQEAAEARFNVCFEKLINNHNPGEDQ